MRLALRYAVAVVAIAAAVVFFLASAEDEGGVSLLAWMRDPEGSRLQHELHLAERRAEARELERSLFPRTDSARRGESARGASGAALAGRAVRLDGSPVVGLTVTAALPERGVGTTDETGRFTLPGLAPQAEARVDLATWILLGTGREPTLEGGEELVLVVAERTRLAGLVTDATGQPLEGALVVGTTPVALAAGEEIGVPLPVRLESSARTDTTGRFVLEDLPLSPFLSVEIRKTGYRSARRGAPATPGAELEVALEALDD